MTAARAESSARADGHPAEAVYDHVWRSRTHLTERTGQQLRVLIVGMMNSALVEFDDGYRCVTSRFGYRRIALGDAAPPKARGE